ncbi:Phage integrase [uncultured Gammaproteobacteria bacterium]|nr:Phage integrase [uncultured Gammaproteobacteria bacterium]
MYYYARRIPSDLKHLYSHQRIVISLRTKVKRVATNGAAHLSQELESYWSSIRIRRLSKLYTNSSLDDSVESSGVLMSEAIEHYLKIKGTEKSRSFANVVRRDPGYAINYLGDRDLSSYNTTDAAKLRDKLFSKGLSSGSVKRVFSSVKAVTGLTIKEMGIGVPNPFLGVFIPNLNDAKKRLPIPNKNIKAIQKACVLLDDIRWITAIISDTGLRLSEVVGLKSSDVILDDDQPYLIIQPNNSRRLKTVGSERKIPLVGASLWGASRASSATVSEYLFDRYNKNERCNANSASAAINKWMRPYVSDGMVIHSMRHSIRNRLRSVEAPVDIIDAIGGWSRGSVGEGYGSGHTVKTLHKWLSRVVIKT